MVPFLQLVLFGYAATFDIKNIPVAIFSMENSSITRRFTEMMTTTGDFVIKKECNGYSELNSAILKGEAKLGIVIPVDFTKKIIRGDETEVQVLVDGSDSNSAIILTNYIKLIVRQLNEEISNNIYSWRQKIMHRLKYLSVPEVRLRMLYNPELRSANFMIPGVVVMVLVISTALLTAMSIVKEKELGTMELLIVTPLKPAEIMLGKLLLFVIIGFVELSVVLISASYIFDIPIKGSIPLLFLFSGIFLLTTLGLGMLISSITSTQQQAMTTAFFVILPMILLSGFIYPIENMPVVIQYITYLIPLRYFLTIIRGIVLKGVGMLHLWDEAMVLLCLGVFFIVAGIRNFRKQLA
jgi:ABC-2 type transport system permease protein